MSGDHGLGSRHVTQPTRPILQICQIDWSKQVLAAAAGLAPGGKSWQAHTAPMFQPLIDIST